jgi:hypothetical protein
MCVCSYLIPLEPYTMSDHRHPHAAFILYDFSSAAWTKKKPLIVYTLPFAGNDNGNTLVA